MFYALVFDMERIDEAIEKGENTIYAEKNNLNEIEYHNIKKGDFCYIINRGEQIKEWPNVKFYYSSKASNLESEYLLNSASWPIVHKKVQYELERNGIQGIQYLPIKLIDVVTKDVNENYVVMNLLNKIEAYDLEKSKYTFNEKYGIYTFIPVDIVLDMKECSSYDIFASNKGAFIILVSQKIKDIIKSSKWVGFDFYKYQNN